MSSFPDLRSFIAALRERGDLLEVTAAVDPCLELAEIHRRIIAESGPALLFKNVRGSTFPVVTNLFGTKARIDLAFGDSPKQFVRDAVELASEHFPPTLGRLWEKRGVLRGALSVGAKTRQHGPVLESRLVPTDLTKLPVIKTWPLDGGPFFTLPLVYTEHPRSGVPNLGMYRMQRFGPDSTGMHMQIGKGGGFHLAEARKRGEALPLNVFLGGPPAAILGAIAPLPENVPEILVASMALGKKLELAKNPYGPLPLLADAEFALVGEVSSTETLPEGPFGDHYGYYSLQHDFPVFRCKQILHRRDAIYPATVVGKPRQEDFFIGDYLQELLSPLFPIVMPSVQQLWSYGETGYHSLAAAVVQERYRREGMMSAFRILGEGQLSLTKFLLLIDRELDLRDFPQVLEYVLERADFRSDLYIFSHLSMDTLDYTGPSLNEGSKGVLLGFGEPKRQLPRDYTGALPQGISCAEAFCAGCLVVSGPSYTADRNAAAEIAQLPEFGAWPLVVLTDDANLATQSTADFLWRTFTRFEPAGDIAAKRVTTIRYHPSLEPPIVIDARMKPSYPAEVECDEETRSTVTKRWSEYFPRG